MASIRKLPSGNFQAAVLVRQGKRQTRTFEDEDAAIAWALELELERNRLRDEAETKDAYELAGLLLDEIERLVDADQLSDFHTNHLLIIADKIIIRNPSTRKCGMTKKKKPKYIKPDYASLFPLKKDKGWQFTPRMAASLDIALSTIADGIYDDVETYGDRPVDPTDDTFWCQLSRLPRLTWRQDHTWRRCVARAAEDLVADLSAGNWPRPKCTAEEVVLHLAMEDICEDELLSDKELKKLPVNPPGVELDDDAYDMLFLDTDFLHLFEIEYDGIEDPDTEINQVQGIGDQRAPNWFTPFYDDDVRDPNRGFRR